MSELQEKMKFQSVEKKSLSAFYRLTTLPLETEKLDRLRSAILKWQQVANEEFEGYLKQCEAQPASPMADYGFDPVGDEAFMFGQTGRVMWASFAVAISSTVEHLFGSICKSLQLTLPAKPNWGNKKDAIEKRLNLNFNSLAEFTNVTLARLLANCFKHNAGVVNAELSQHDGRSVDAEIEYEKEPWQTILADTKSFMTAVVDRLDAEVVK